MPVEWKCRSCNYVFASRDHPEACPFCHRKKRIEIFGNVRDFVDLDMD